MATEAITNHDLPNHSMQRLEPAVYVSYNSGALGGWLATLMLVVGHETGYGI
jgi:hypothetical protein